VSDGPATARGPPAEAKVVWLILIIRKSVPPSVGDRYPAASLSLGQ
jgi:hypothetical protein